MDIELLEKLSKLIFLTESAADSFSEDDNIMAKVNLQLASGIIDNLLEEEC